MKRSGLKVFFGVAGAVISAAAGVVALYTFLTGRGSIGDEAFEGIEYFHSASLGVEVIQGNTKREMVSSESYGESFYDAYEVRMKPAPFRLILPRRSDDDVVQICAWTDDSIFAEVYRDRPVAEVPFFRSGTGIAGAEFSVPILFLNDEGHNYYQYERLERVSDFKHGASFSKVWQDGEETHLSKVEGPIYMVIFMDLDRDDILDFGEFEYFVLQF